ncbi:MAG: hypothetical protein GY716_21915 [bacterium]|nr:hypothetical protein [bacterium]
MRRASFVLGIVALAAVLATSASAQGRGVEWIELGLYDDISTFMIDLTPDGSTAGGSQGGLGFAGNCLQWNEVTGYTFIAESGSVCYMSADGTQWATRVYDDEGFEHMARVVDGVSTIVNEHADLASCDSFLSGTFGISGDGKTIVGLGWHGTCDANAITSIEDCDADGESSSDTSSDGDSDDDSSAAECVPGGTMTLYEGWVPDRANRMNAANFDGSLLVGWQDTEFGSRLGAFWANGAEIGEWYCPPTENPDDPFCGEALRTNSSGDAVVGTNYSSPDTFGIREGWLKAGTDEIRGTGQLPGAFFLDSGVNVAVAENGKTTGGRFGFGPFSSAVIWTEATGILNVNQFLVDQGLTQPFDGWFLVQVQDISGNTDTDGDDADSDSASEDDDGSSDDGSSEESDDDNDSDDTDDRMRLLVVGNAPDNSDQSVIIDISTVSVCHVDPLDPMAEPRTLTVSWDAMPDHVGHGDFLGTCEAAGGGFSRAASASQHYGIDKTDKCFQDAVKRWTANNSAFALPSAEEIAQMKAATCNERVNDGQSRGKTQRLGSGRGGRR